MNKAVFLDRDGVINEEVKLLYNIKQLKLIPKSDKGIKLLNNLGFRVIVATNQPQVARGLITENSVKRINKTLIKVLAKKDAKIDAIYYCPHHPERHHPDIKPECMKYRIECECRKPNIGMIKKAEKELKIDLKSSYIIGDQTRDIKTGKNAGCKTILVKTGYAGKDGKYDVKPDFIAKNLLEAAKIIENDVKKLKAVIIAGGRGERLRPLTDKLPKPMLPIAGKPILEHQINLLRKIGVEDIIICGYYLFDKIKEYFSDGKKFGVNITYCDEKTPLDTGGALKNSEHFIYNTFFVLYGDTMIDLNLKKLLDFHKRKGGLATIVLHETDHPEDSDLVDIDKNKKIIKFYRKPHKIIKSKLGKSSLYVLEKEIFKFVSSKKHSFHAVDIPKIIKKKHVYGYVTSEFIKDAGTPNRYREIDKFFKRKLSIS
ncbi:MAG TPA: HAD-IIIA family hydrolase [Candidatus Nanoarchaeia archaeon]|nr:HAD-IIIA family hydrolase [Candidatus Nanoarchaeia archaeon]